MSKRVWTIFAAAFLIRMIALNQSLWLDEATTAKVVMHIPFVDIIRTFSPFDFHPPLYYLFMKAWSGVFGFSESSLRMPSVLFSLIAGWFVLRSAEMFKKGSGFWSSAFFLFNPLSIYYSQEARMYMMTVCFLSIALYGVLRLVKRTDMLVLIAVNISIGLSMLTFYGSIFFIASLFVYLLYMKKYRLFFELIPGFVIASLIVSPLLYTQLLHSREALGIVKNWSMVLGKVTFKNLLLIPLKFSIGRIQYYPKTLYYATSGLWTAVVLYFVIRGGKRSPRTAYFLLMPLALGCAISLVTPLLQYFRFLFLLIPFCLLLEEGAGGRFQRGIILTGFLMFSAIYLLIPSLHRENWKQAVASVPEHTMIYMILPSSDPVRYYRPGDSVQELRSIGEEHSLARSIVVLPYSTEIYGYPYQQKLKSLSYTKTKEQSFRGIIVEYWER